MALNLAGLLAVFGVALVGFIIIYCYYKRCKAAIPQGKITVSVSRASIDASSVARIVTRPSSRQSNILTDDAICHRVQSIESLL